jgi:hypothetical protein
MGLLLLLLQTVVALCTQVLHEQFDAVAPRIYGATTTTTSSSSWPSPAAGRPQLRSPAQQQHSHQQQQQQQGAFVTSPAAAAAAAAAIRPTVIQIAHELSAIMSYDSVAVMAAGQVVEVGSPQQLAAQEGSRFARLLLQEGH